MAPRRGDHSPAPVVPTEAIVNGATSAQESPAERAVREAAEALDLAELEVMRRRREHDAAVVALVKSTKGREPMQMISEKEAARMLDVTPRTVRDVVRPHVVHKHLSPKCVRYELASIEAYARGRIGGAA